MLEVTRFARYASIQDELANLKEGTDWLSMPKVPLRSHYTSRAFFVIRPRGRGSTNQSKVHFLLSYDIFERIHLSLIWPCISHNKCCHFFMNETHVLTKICTLVLWKFGLDRELSSSKILPLHVFERGHFTTCSSRGRRDVNTREF